MSYSSRGCEVHDQDPHLVRTLLCSNMTKGKATHKRQGSRGLAKLTHLNRKSVPRNTSKSINPFHPHIFYKGGALLT